MAEDIVLLQISGRVAEVTLNRPDAQNAFDEMVFARLNEIFGQLAEDDDIVAVVLRGRGKNFSAGGDLRWMKRAASFSEKENEQDAFKLAQMLNRLYTLPQVTIACVRGAAMGGGMGLACCCDVVIADRSAIFALSEVKLGLIPATIGPYVLAALGARQARRYFQTGERVSAEKAYEIGLAHEIVSGEAAMETTLKGILDAVAANGPRAMRAAKALCLDLAEQPITAQIMEKTARLIAATRAGSEAREGIAAFLEKRRAAWMK